MTTFTAQIKNFAKKTDENIMKAVRQAIQDMVTEAQTPVRKGGGGGKMPVDTGFLRSSGLATLNVFPSGPGKGRARTKKDPPTGPLPEYNTDYGEQLQIVLAKMKKGDLFYWGWTARYAELIEERYGFADSAIMNFQYYLDKACAKLNV